MHDPLIIAGRSFESRLIVGTGKYKDGAETQRAIEASGAEMVTVAVRRVNLDRSKESLLDYIDPQRYFLLPNTAGCYTADEAIRAVRIRHPTAIGNSCGAARHDSVGCRALVGDRQLFLRHHVVEAKIQDGVLLRLLATQGVCP